MKAAWIALAAGVLSFGRTTTTKKATALPAKQDTWQKSKECASKAEKLMAELDRRGQGAWHWENHYSPKYNRCFISATYITSEKDGGSKDRSLFSIQLVDAFERSVLANSAFGGATEGFCDIDGKTADCEKAASFIAEHMKN